MRSILKEAEKAYNEQLRVKEEKELELLRERQSAATQAIRTGAELLKRSVKVILGIDVETREEFVVIEGVTFISGTTSPRAQLSLIAFVKNKDGSVSESTVIDSFAGLGRFLNGKVVLLNYPKEDAVPFIAARKRIALPEDEGRIFIPYENSSDSNDDSDPS